MNLLTKSLPTSVFEELRNNIGKKRFQNVRYFMKGETVLFLFRQDFYPNDILYMYVYINKIVI